MSFKIKSLILLTIICIVSSDIVFLSDTNATTKACPKVTCSDETKEDKTCVVGKGKASTGERTVTINACAEDDKNFCNWVSNFSDLYTDVDKDSDCKTIPKPVKVADRYPGEACDDELHTCKLVPQWDETKKSYTNKSECKDSVCTGAGEGVKCQDNTSCVAGFYCKANVCTKQVDIEGDCEKSKDCVNNGICYEKKCIKVYSLKIGSDVSTSKTDSKFYACESMVVTTGSKCAETDYQEDKQNDGDDFKECEADSLCKYDMWDNEEKKNPSTTTEHCVCGFNADGKGYCPLPSSKAATAGVKVAQDLLNNDRHTESRGSGAIDRNAKCDGWGYNPLYNGIDDCAKKILGYGACNKDDGSSSSSSSYIKITLALISIIALFF